MKLLKRLCLVGIMFLPGCEALDRLATKQGSRDGAYDNSPAPVNVPRLEPYAVFEGKHYWPDGTSTKLYLIYWKGNALNMVTELEADIDAIHLPKYESL